MFEANIKNVAVEKHFYTQPANTSVDDEITELERGFARLLDRSALCRAAAPRWTAAVISMTRTNKSVDYE